MIDQPYQIPETKDQWWNNVNLYWKDLYGILCQFLPMSDHVRYCEDHSNAFDVDVQGAMKPLHQWITEAKETKDPVLVRYFSMAWNRAPDRSFIHTLPGWNVLCDLCSEEYVLYNEEEL